MEVHVAFVAITEVRHRIFRPLVCLSQKHSTGIFGIHVFTHPLQELVRLWQILVAGAFTLVKIRNRVEAHAVDTHVHPEIEHFIESLLDLRIVEV